MPGVQEHPDKPQGGRKYGAFQKVESQLYRKGSNGMLTPVSGYLHGRSKEEQIANSHYRPEQARGAGKASSGCEELQLCCWWSRREGYNGC